MRRGLATWGLGAWWGGLRVTWVPIFSLYTFTYTVPSAVLNVMLTESTGSLLATWDAPLSPNGVLEYTLTLNQTDLARPTTVLPQLTNVTNQTEFLFSFILPPYHLYTVTVTPFTGAGEGEAGMDSLQTNESSM